ncbi:condensation domain-containing protein [Kitasatospora aburaviensis]
MQEAYLVGSSRLVELGGFRPAYYVELDLVNADLARAERALRQLVRRHAHLRTVVDEGGTQRVLPEEETPPVSLAVTDLGGLDEDARREALARTRETMCREGVAPTGWPLFEITVNRLRPRRVRVHLAMSLLLLDGRGIRQVMDEWRALYHDPAAELPEPGASYRDCRLELLANEDTPGYRDQWRYWEQRLDDLPDAPGCRWPSSRPRSPRCGSPAAPTGSPVSSGSGSPPPSATTGCCRPPRSATCSPRCSAPGPRRRTSA